MDTQKFLLERLKSLEVSDATYKPMNNPLIYHRGLGSEVWDVEGRRFIDFCAGFGSLALGHSPELVRKIFSKQATDPTPLVIQGMGDVYPSLDKIELIDELMQSMPEHLKRVSLAVTGSQAVETAIKTAMLKTQKYRFITFKGSYHGLDFGALKLTSNTFFHEGFVQWSKHGSEDFVSAQNYNCDPSLIEQELKNHFGKATQYAAIVVEPIQGRGGVIVAEKDWLKDLKNLCGKYDALLIFDEIFCGLGRSGVWTSSFEVKADIICLGKALGGGMPISACVGTEEAMAAWPENSGEARQTGTFFGHPLSCRIAKSILQEMSNLELDKRAIYLGEKIKLEIGAQLKNINPQASLRGSGLMLAFDLNVDGAGAKMMDILRQNGVIALAAGEKGNCLQITPALNISEELLSEGLQILLKNLPSIYV